MRNIQDAALTASKALPAANASASTAGIDLGQTTADVINEGIEVLLTCPATPALVEAKTITFTFNDSADNSTFAAIEELATVVSTGGTGNGAAAIEQRVKLPSSTKRYINVSAAVLLGGGDNTGVSFTVKVLN